MVFSLLASSPNALDSVPQSECRTFSYYLLLPTQQSHVPLRQFRWNFCRSTVSILRARKCVSIFSCKIKRFSRTNRRKLGTGQNRSSHWSSISHRFAIVAVPKLYADSMYMQFYLNFCLLYNPPKTAQRASISCSGQTLAVNLTCYLPSPW